MAGRFAAMVKAHLLVMNHVSGTLPYETQLLNPNAERFLPPGGNGNHQRVMTAFDFLEIIVPRDGFTFASGDESESDQPRARTQLLPPFGLV